MKTVKTTPRDRPFLFVITGIRYNRVNLFTKMANLNSKFIRYNQVFVISEYSS
jgi:hypothetical protein